MGSIQEGDSAVIIDHEYSYNLGFRVRVGRFIGDYTDPFLGDLYQNCWEVISSSFEPLVSQCPNTGAAQFHQVSIVPLKWLMPIVYK